MPRPGGRVAAQAREHLVGGAGDDRLDPLQFLQRHAVRRPRVGVEGPATGLRAVLVDPHGHEQGRGDVPGPPPRPARRVPYGREPGGVVGRVGRIGQPSVVASPRAVERGRRGAAQPDRRPAGAVWPGGGRDAVEPEDLAVEGGLALPQRAPERHGLVEPREAALPRNLRQRVERPSEPAGKPRADRDRQPAPAEQVDRREGLGGLDRPPQEGQQRARSQGHVLGRRGERGQHGQRLDARADQGVVDEERGEPRAFRPAAEGDQLSGIAVRAPLGGSGRKQHTDVHAGDARDPRGPPAIPRREWPGRRGCR